jgi:pyridoxal phosphate-dependent aminotransferase EpsN
MPITEPDAPNYWLTCLTLQSDGEDGDTPSRDTVLAALAAEDIEARPLWKPLHMQPVFRDQAYFGGSVAEQLFAHGLCLPSGSGMSASERQRVIDTLLATGRNH